MRAIFACLITAFPVYAADKPKHDPDATYKGIAAATWGKRALDAEDATAINAVDALAFLKSNGVPYLVNAIKKNSFVRASCAFYLSGQEDARAYAVELIPPLKEMLNDDTDYHQACRLCAWLGKDSAPLLEKLKEIAKRKNVNSPAPQWAAEAVAAIEKAKK